MCGGSAALLAILGASTAGATHARLDAVVSMAVLAVGAVAAALLTVGCVLLTLTAVARATGRTLDRLERATTRLTPALLRRAVAVTITTGIGLGAVSGVATASEIDLGWEVTESTSVPDEPAHPEPAAETPGLGEAEAEAEATEQVATPESAGSASTEPDPARSEFPVAARQEPAGPGPDVEPARAGMLDLAGAPAAGGPTSTTTITTDGTTTDGTTATAATTHPAADAVPTVAATVTVRAGDTLWDIAAAHLPAGSDDAAIAAAWPHWYETNRDVVGPDPGLIHPGHVLTAPGAP